MILECINCGEKKEVKFNRNTDPYRTARGWEVWEDSKGNIMDVCPDCAKLQRD